jgi:hypothetical protein
VVVQRPPGPVRVVGIDQRDGVAPSDDVDGADQPQTEWVAHDGRQVGGTPVLKPGQDVRPGRVAGRVEEPLVGSELSLKVAARGDGRERKRRDDRCTRQDVARLRQRAQLRLATAGQDEAVDALHRRASRAG